jgi:hypothetical protein
VIEGNIRVERMRRGERRCKQPLDDFKETRRYWKLKAEALDRALGEVFLEEAVDLS